MNLYRIETGQAQRRAAVTAWLDGLEFVEQALRELIVTAWVSVWVSSTHETLEDMPYSMAVPDYPLMRHVNEVTRTGLALARLSKKEWGDTIDLATLVPTLILHDVDKPLLFGRKNGKVEPLPLCRELSHGVVGAMILKELGFAHPIVSAVANHAASAPFHGGTVEAYVLHYADFFVSDHVLRNAGLEPFYQKHGR